MSNEWILWDFFFIGLWCIVRTMKVRETANGQWIHFCINYPFETSVYASISPVYVKHKTQKNTFIQQTKTWCFYGLIQFLASPNNICSSISKIRVDVYWKQHRNILDFCSGIESWLLMLIGARLYSIQGKKIVIDTYMKSIASDVPHFTPRTGGWENKHTSTYYVSQCNFL